MSRSGMRRLLRIALHVDERIPPGLPRNSFLIRAGSCAEEC